MMIITKKCYYYYLITLSNVNFLFDHMLMNSLAHTYLSLIIKRHGELTKFTV